MNDVAFLSDAVEVIKQKYSNINILLFGSYARNEESDDSDIDLCFILENSEKK